MNEQLKIKDSTKVWLCPTDTIYGLSARVGDVEAVERIQQIKGRGNAMGLIVLISDIEQLKIFGIILTENQEGFLSKVWPGKVSVIFGKVSAEYQHLAGGFEWAAFRLPDYSELRELIRKVGPIVSTSANRHGEVPFTTVEQAKDIFGTEIDEYLGAGELKGEASTLVKIVR